MRNLDCAKSVASSEPINRCCMPNCYTYLPAKCVGRSVQISSQVFQEHESFVRFGRHLARASGIEATFRRASYVNGQVSARHIRDNCPYSWNSWLILVSGLIGACLLGGVLAFVYKRNWVKLTPT